ARVVLGVGGGRHDQQRAPRGSGRERTEQLPGLGRVGGSDDQRELHAPILARAEDILRGWVHAPTPAGGACAAGGRRACTPANIFMPRRAAPLPPREAWPPPWPTARRIRRATCRPRSAGAPGARGSPCRSGP